MTILTRRGPIDRLGDLLGNSQGPPIAVQGRAHWSSHSATLPSFLRIGIDLHVAVVVSLCTDGNGRLDECPLDQTTTNTPVLPRVPARRIAGWGGGTSLID